MFKLYEFDQALRDAIRVQFAYDTEAIQWVESLTSAVTSRAALSAARLFRLFEIGRADVDKALAALRRGSPAYLSIADSQYAYWTVPDDNTDPHVFSVVTGIVYSSIPEKVFELRSFDLTALPPPR